MRRFAALLAVLALAPAAMADEAPPPQWQGTWRGTIGAIPVHACFSSMGDSYRKGAYFYLSSKRLIGLDSDEHDGWIERAGKGGAESGRWALSVSPDGKLRGEWRGGGKVLPVTLTRSGSAGEQEEGCTSRAFIAPRLQPAKITLKPAKVPGLAYSLRTYDVGPLFPEVSLQDFTFVPVQKGDLVILSAIRLQPDKPGGRGDYASCMQGAIGLTGSDGEYGIDVNPEWATPAFLAVHESTGGFCGGAHPSFDYERQLWDRQSGQRVDMARWFLSSAVTPSSDGRAVSVHEISEDLRTAVLPYLKAEDAECKDAAASQEWWNIGANSKGFVFTPSMPHVIAACVDDAFVPYAAVSRFLSTLGRKQVARLRDGGW